MAATAAPSLGPGHDSGELTTAAYCGGVTHPPGYPLYVLGAHLWGAVLRGDYAWRINLFSGAGVAGAAALLAAVLLRATESRPAALVGGLGFALLGSVWRQGVVAEVFGLHFCLMALLAWLGWRVVERCHKQQSPGLYLGAFYAVLGLCLAHHHTFVLALPGLLLLAWGHWPRVLLTPWWFLMLTVALLFYGDMLIRARGEPSLNWGAVTHLDSLWAHFLRKSYGTFKLTVEVDPLDHGVAHGLAYLLFTYAQQAPLPFMALATWGALRGWKRQPRLWALALAWLLAFGPFFALIGRQKLGAFQLDMLERFYASSYLGLALLAGLGASLVAIRVRPLTAWLGALSLMVWLFYSNLPACRLDQRELAVSYGKTVLANCPSGSVLLVYGDLPVGIFWYLQKVEGIRPDVNVVFHGLLASGWYRSRLSTELRAALPSQRGEEELALARWAEARGRSIFFTQHRGLPGSWRPRALCWQYYLSPSPLSDLDRLQECLRRLLADSALLAPGLTGEGRFWPRFLISSRTRSLRHLAGALYNTQPRLALEASLRLFELGANQPLDYLNRGLLWQRLGRHRQALEDFRHCLALDPELELAQAARVYSEAYLKVEAQARALGEYCAP